MSFRDVNVAEHSLMPATQLVLREYPLLHRLGAKKHLPHDQMLAAGADTSARLQLPREGSSEPRNKCDFAEADAAKPKLRPLRGGPSARGQASARRRTPGRRPSATRTRCA